MRGHAVGRQGRRHHQVQFGVPIRLRLSQLHPVFIHRTHTCAGALAFLFLQLCASPLHVSLLVACIASCMCALVHCFFLCLLRALICVTCSPVFGVSPCVHSWFPTVADLCCPCSLSNRTRSRWPHSNARTTMPRISVSWSSLLAFNIANTPYSNARKTVCLQC